MLERLAGKWLLAIPCLMFTFSMLVSGCGLGCVAQRDAANDWHLQQGEDVADPDLDNDYDDEGREAADSEDWPAWGFRSPAHLAETFAMLEYWDTGGVGGQIYRYLGSDTLDGEDVYKVEIINRDHPQLGAHEIWIDTVDGWPVLYLIEGVDQSTVNPRWEFYATVHLEHVYRMRIVAADAKAQLPAGEIISDVTEPAVFGTETVDVRKIQYQTAEGPPWSPDIPHFIISLEYIDLGHFHLVTRYESEPMGALKEHVLHEFKLR